MEKLRTGKINDWAMALLLALPLAVFFLAYFFYHSPDLSPTGFIQFDNVGYVAYAHQYLDGANNGLLYSNPFALDASPIYFQPQTLLFALLMKLGVSPGMLLIPFTLVCSVICFRLLIAIYDHLAAPSRFRSLHLWLLAWGGGLLALAGMVANAWFTRGTSWFYDIFILDPEHGWWGLNFGRSLLFSCEAYYHALFLAAAYSLLKKRWLPALIFIFLLSLSHPFTGIELIGIAAAWCLVEIVISRRSIPWWFAVGIVLALTFHIYYYLVYLNGSADHHSVSSQYSLNWRLRFYRMIPAYAFTGTLAIASLRKAGFRNFFQALPNRFLACWFLVAFSLANHEWFIKPMQPVHFTRGYIWTSLFLLGLPALQTWSGVFRQRWKWAGLAVSALFFLDNFLWIGQQSLSKDSEPSARYITAEQKEILSMLKTASDSRTLIVSSDQTIAVLSAVQTSATPWYSHPFTTPFAAEKKAAQDSFLRQGRLDSRWLGRPVNFLLYRSDSIAAKALAPLQKSRIIKTGNYILYVCGLED